MIVWSLFIISHMGLFVYTQKGSIISMVDLPTTEIIEPFFNDLSAFLCYNSLITLLREQKKI